MKFLRIREWEKYQHYKDRNPPWIKLYQELMTSVVWVTGDDASRTLAVSCLLLAARTGNKIPLDRDYIQRCAYLKRRPDIRPLVDCGFAEVIEEPTENTVVVSSASTMLASPETTLAECYTRDRDREELVETEKNARPTLEEVIQYCNQRQNQVDAAKWFDYYSANGWRVGRNPMKNWQAAVRTWEKNGFGGAFDDGHKTAAQLRNERASIAIDRAFAAEEIAGDMPEALRKGTGRV